MVFQLMLSPGATHDFILASIFSQNFMTCLMNQAAAENRYLHRAALKALASIEQAVEAEPEILQPILKGLLTGNGDYCFDQRTHGKTIEHLLSKAPESDKVPIISLLRTPVLNMKGSEPQQIENKRRLYAEYLLQLASGCLAADSDTARANLLLILKELIRVAYSKAGDFDPPLTETTRDIARIRVGTAFSKAIKTPSNCPVVCDAILSADLDGVEMDDELSTEYRTAFTQLHQYRHENVDDSYGLSLLYAAAIYLLLNGDEDAVEILNDLYDCGDPMRLPAGVRDKPDADKIFVEILLNLVSRPSAFMKQVTHRVFENFALNVDENALRLLTDPLAVEENIKGKETLFGTGESGGQEEDEEDENDSDVETVDTAAAGAGAESDAEQLEDESSSAASDSGSGDNEDDSSSAGDDSSSLEDDSSSDDEAQDNGDSQALDDALAKILNSHRLDKDAEAESSSDDSDMTDNEMIAIDKQLTEAFKMRVQRKSTKKKDQKSAKEAVVNFKNRVLDFIDIYVKVAPTKKESFGLLLPLLRLVRTTKNKNLATRACGTIVAFWKAFSRERSSKRNPFPLEKLDASGMPALLEAIHKDASLDPSHAYAKAASTASILVSSVLLHTAVSREAGVERIWTAYGKTMADWVTGKIRVQPSFFTECVNWLQGYASTAAMADG